jgi:hypothetical protein
MDASYQWFQKYGRPHQEGARHILKTANVKNQMVGRADILGRLYSNNKLIIFLKM